MVSNTSDPLIFSSRGNGKLLLSGEYLVLKGARALSVPLKLGQSLAIYQSSEPGFAWEARHPQGIWNTVQFNTKLNINSASNTDFAEQLQKILKLAMNAGGFEPACLKGKKAITQMDFMPEWGLGSSSTLIYNVAAFFNVDAYHLLKYTFGGSGYDIAIAGRYKPIFFNLIKGRPQVAESDFNPPFSKNIYFVYTNKKQSSKEAIKGFKQKNIASERIRRISAISDLMSTCSRLGEFQELMTEHEDIIGRILGVIPVQQKHFSDFDGCIKSLGAWGGDFIMAATHMPQDDVMDYFGQKNMKTIFSYKQLIMS
ncbi:Mevalonate kinase [Saccharicrinis carchari]|uniref:Mevalonate kinase n=1 Tax=Saccharicrinis carchari TaxID=1168039 RepID=A0A521AGZ8_SACCC|nr:GYDIA family GHMP kinase [Saccharicrinis carchari]SMO34091.1 Mevalonate kinase [Saccharicrinis carchari]